MYELTVFLEDLWITGAVVPVLFGLFLVCHQLTYPRA